MATPYELPNISSKSTEEPIAHEEVAEPDEMVCRNCLSEDEPHDLIAPCKVH